MSKKFKNDELRLEVEVGRFARQADGAVWIRSGETVVLSTAVASKSAKDFMGFFPLTVEYREKTSAAGRIPGGFVKREGRLSDHEILVSRMIDRPVRPLFPKFYFNEVQILTTVYSSDGSYPTDALGIVASSLALTISPIPFAGPVGAVRVIREDGKWVFNPDHTKMHESDTGLTIAGVADGIVMVEGYTDNLSEDELVDVLFEAHEHIKKQIEWQREIAREVGADEKDVVEDERWKVLHSKVNAFVDSKKDVVSGFFGRTKEVFNTHLDLLRDDLIAHFASLVEAGEVTEAELKFLFDLKMKDLLPDAIAHRKERFDGRPFDQVRELDMEVGLLPRAHGSALFQRGETQALTSVTLGTPQDVQRTELLIEGLIEKRFMLHYNFPPFSTGEVRPMRGVSRREVGHGYLAERSFYNVMPHVEDETEGETDFPYTIRANTDVLESNGSSSMATVCATSLALMDAGVPLKDIVGGVAMGLIQDSSGSFHVLTDILGSEDAFGLMDFKVTGTEKGIMAVQMDIKAQSGLTKDIFKKALAQAKDARLHILESMKKILAAPRTKLSQYAPRIITHKVPTEKIGLIIGPGGKTIKEIIAQTGVEINIDDNGSVKIFSTDGEAAQKAIDMITAMIGDVEVGAEYEGTIRRFMEFGMLVEILPGKTGLVHVSTIDKKYADDLESHFKVGDKIKVKVLHVDEAAGRIRMVAPEIERADRDRSNDSRGSGGRGGGDRGGRDRRGGGRRDGDRGGRRDSGRRDRR